MLAGGKMRASGDDAGRRGAMRLPIGAQTARRIMITACRGRVQSYLLQQEDAPSPRTTSLHLQASINSACLFVIASE